MIDPDRINDLNNQPPCSGRYVLYWMQAAQRADWNHALEWAILQANKRKLPVLVLFCLVDDFPEANLRHYRFMLEGLRETREALARRGMGWVLHRGSPLEGVLRWGREAAQVVTDTGHLRIQRKWRTEIGRKLPCSFTEVETNLVVPVEIASDKANFSAGTLRPRIHRQLARFMVPLRHTRLRQRSLDLGTSDLDLSDIDHALSRLQLDRSVPALSGLKGGTRQAQRRLREFLQHRLDGFADQRNDPAADRTSGLSPYLHFGQISPLRLALAAAKTDSPGRDAFLEELIVRRELAHNFVHYNPDYDRYKGLAPWARRTLNFHRRDKREYQYSQGQFERAETHDPYWNAAQQEMVITGKMHGYMRMYWGKKILEWTPSPQEGFRIALALNNKYELDGRDPNGFAGVAWCFGQHDRAWSERPVYGKVRYMNANGLKRKFDIETYVQRVGDLSSGTV